MHILSQFNFFFFINGRGGSSSTNITVGERLLSTLLTEMDGLEQAKVIIYLVSFSQIFLHLS